MAMVFLNSMVVIIFGAARLLIERKLEYLEYFNETMIQISTVHLFVFTNFLDDAETRFLVGYSLIAFTLLTISVNLGIMII
jgi:hypothetical protein